MKLEAIIGKTITNIYCISGVQDEWLDTAECYIELDRTITIRIPSGYSKEIFICEPDEKAESLFGNFEDYPHYHVNKEKKSIEEIRDRYNRRKKNIFNRIRKVLFGHEITMDEYRPYKIEYMEDKMKYIPNRKIVDILWFEGEKEEGYLLLDNGYLVSETIMSPSGTGLAGLNYYESLEDLEKIKGDHCIKFTDNK